MKTEISDLTIQYFEFLNKFVSTKLTRLELSESEEDILHQINSDAFFQHLNRSRRFSFTKFESEIQSNLLNIKSDADLINYLYYLIKIYFKIKQLSAQSHISLDAIKKMYITEEDEEEFFWRMADIDQPYKTKKDVVEDIYRKSLEGYGAPLQLFVIFKNQFGFKVKDWREINVLKEMPSFFEVKKMILPETKETLDEEKIPEYEFDSEAQKIAWLHRLGVIDTVLKHCKDGETFIWRRAANIINSFTGINSDTIRKCLMAIYSPGSGNDKNNPLINPSNKLFILEMTQKFKLNQEK